MQYLKQEYEELHNKFKKQLSEAIESNKREVNNNFLLKTIN